MLYDRNILEFISKTKKSLLLLGPRQTGKSTLLASLKPNITINLAREIEFLAFAADPGLLEKRLHKDFVGTVFIDEIQRLPSLLNTIQALIDERKQKIRFFLTGSSARKLRRGQANLLPGRIHVYTMTPLVASELDYECDIEQILATGTLPGIYSESEIHEREKTLESYAAIYLREEIQAEALTRNIEGFARFLKFAAISSTQFLDLQKLANEAQINHQTVRRYFEILEDTMIVHSLPAFAKSDRQRLIQHPRYFIFDNGVLNSLLGNFKSSLDRKGMLFENMFCTQVFHGLASKDRKNVRLSSYRTEHGAEVDLIVEDSDGTIRAIELKASRNVGKSDLSGLKSFAKFVNKNHQPIIAYLGEHKQTIDGVEVLPWIECLREIGL